MPIPKAKKARVTGVAAGSRKAGFSSFRLKRPPGCGDCSRLLLKGEEVYLAGEGTVLLTGHLGFGVFLFALACLVPAAETGLRCGRRQGVDQER